MINKIFFFALSIIIISGCKKNDTNNKPVHTKAVYMAGAKMGTIYQAMYWKDGIAKVLSDGEHDAIATSMVISGNDLYIGGFENNGSNYIAKYWKNKGLLRERPF
jgi:hypothetical protein